MFGGSRSGVGSCVCKAVEAKTTTVLGFIIEEISYEYGRDETTDSPEVVQSISLPMAAGRGEPVEAEGLMLCGFWPIQPRDLSVARRGVYQVDANPGCAAKSQHLCCCIGQIDDPACDHWTPVIDAHDDRSVIMQVSHANQSAQRKAAVGTRHSIHVEGFAARGWLALESVAIP
jgi:hypothetical protein